MARSLDFDEQQLRVLTYEAARGASAQRFIALTDMVTGLETVSAGAAQPESGSPDPGERAAAGADVDQVSTELMMRQACYRSAAAAIANPIAPSLLEFIA